MKNFYLTVTDKSLSTFIYKYIYMFKCLFLKSHKIGTKHVFYFK